MLFSNTLLTAATFFWFAITVNAGWINDLEPRTRPSGVPTSCRQYSCPSHDNDNFPYHGSSETSSTFTCQYKILRNVYENCVYDKVCKDSLMSVRFDLNS
ncbi:hypothetical protein FRB93_003932 [Tulasnella sp. JGI-2019a]|nr:hypothetical protein FRB93_003932 [Tulasnella sp. JGI-2019a]